MLSRGAPSASVLVIGGAGFVGESIIARLQSSGYAVSCLDIAMPSKAVQDVCVSFHTGEITDNDCLADVFSAVRPEIVIHLASFGMSGADMLNPKCFGVNVTGTDNILNACIAWNVQLLIYTSSYNVIFGGQEIYNGVESRMQYFPRKMAVDHYGQTKALAEQAIISANGSRCSNGQTFLKTCSIRPAAIYGENERRHFSRIIQHIDSGVFIFRIGTALVDWVYIDNLVRKIFL